MTIQTGQMVYAQSVGTTKTNYPVISTRDPTSNDVNFSLGQFWVNTSGGSLWYLNNQSTIGGYLQSTWYLIARGSGDLNTLTGNTGGAIDPDTSANINILGSGIVNVAGNNATSTLTISTTPGGYPITPFVVGPVGQAGYQTIQSALDAANAAGGGIVYVQPATYTENLTLYGTVGIVGVPGNSDSATAGNCTIISGVHVPPATGSVSFINLHFVSATDIFNSAVAGSASIVIENASFQVTNGYTFNLPNWTGALVVYDIGDNSTNNGLVNNTGGALCFFISATLGAGSANTMMTTGSTILQDVDLNCPWNAITGSTVQCDYVVFTQPISLLNDSAGGFSYCRFVTGASTAITMSSSGIVFISSSIINSSAVPVIAGAGAGTLTLTDVNFLGNSNISGGLTLAYGNTLTGTAYLQNVSFDNGVNTMNTDGQLIIGSTGTNPVINTLTAGAGISITNGAGSITISSSSGGMTWQVVTTDQTGADNNGYIVDTAGNVNVALPATSSIGETFEVNSIGAGTFTITQAAGQQVIVGSVTTTLGAAGTIVGTGIGNWIQLTCYQADTLWIASVKQGTVVVS